MADMTFGINREDIPTAHDFEYIPADDEEMTELYNEIISLLESDPWADEANAWQTENAPF